MKKFAEIDNGRVRKIYVQESRPIFAPYIKILDVTEVDPMPQEDWFYNATTGEFNSEFNLPEIVSQPSAAEVQIQTLLNTEYLVIMSELTNI